MATYNKTELRTAALYEVGALAAGQTASAEDAALADARIQQVLEGLADKGLVYWDYDGEIPAPAFLPLANIVAATLAGPFGAIARKQELEAMAEEGRRELRRLKAPPYFHSPMRADYF